METAVELCKSLNTIQMLVKTINVWSEWCWKTWLFIPQVVDDLQEFGMFCCKNLCDCCYVWDCSLGMQLFLVHSTDIIRIVIKTIIRHKTSLKIVVVTCMVLHLCKTAPNKVCYEFGAVTKPLRVECCHCSYTRIPQSSTVTKNCRAVFLSSENLTSQLVYMCW